MPMTSWLHRRGFTPLRSGIRINVDCTLSIVDRLEQLLEKYVAKTGHKAFVIGQSRGGYLGRLLATRRPDLVDGLVMVGSPVVDPLGAHPAVMHVAKRIARAGDFDVPGLMTEECMRGECATRVKEQLKVALEVPAVAFHARSDTIVPCG